MSKSVLLLTDTLEVNRSLRNAGAVILKLAYGIECKPIDDPDLAMSEQLTKITAEATRPGRWLCDSFPSCIFNITITIYYHKTDVFVNSGLYPCLVSGRILQAVGSPGTRSLKGTCPCSF